VADDLRAGIEALIPSRGEWLVSTRELRALLAAHSVQDECLDCGRTDGGCDRVVEPASAKVAPSYAKTGSWEPLCERPPKGWICARLRGHRGPCLSLMETL